MNAIIKKLLEDIFAFLIAVERDTEDTDNDHLAARADELSERIRKLIDPPNMN